MTAQEQLHQLVDAMSDEAARILQLLPSQREGKDPTTDYLAGAPVDDEPFTVEEGKAARGKRKGAVTRRRRIDALVRELARFKRRA